MRLQRCSFHAVILGDTMGELSAIWGLADIAFVGGSLDGKRGGQNMIEPAAYGAAVLFGPHTWNFKDTVANLLAHQGAIRVADSNDLEAEILRLLGFANRRCELGEAAKRFVASQQGATAWTLDCLSRILAPEAERRAA
jgi:3-deoxy-D-manno-octulosonic-acid transferase